jgi:hypothetical protein
MYVVTAYSKRRAKKLGVRIEPSTSKGKKLDVYKKGKKVASIGALGYKDYPTFKKESLSLANKKRTLYKQRHAKDRKRKGTPGYYADQILW